ncbi:MAG: hypothetical protein JSS27_01775 [Planctomycetes bacterium]|nr:hypothetical protein [Planctomycetota bacterium]
MAIITKHDEAQSVERLLQGLIKSQGNNERRGDDRVEISLAVAIVPCVDGDPMPDFAFAAFTRNISSDGVSLVINRPVPSDELIVGFPGTPMTFVLAKVLHRDGMALGCSRLGLRMTEVVDLPPHPGLERFLMQ